MPTLLLFADRDAVSMRHIAEFFALFEGGVRDARLARSTALRTGQVSDSAGLHALQFRPRAEHGPRNRSLS